MVVVLLSLHLAAKEWGFCQALCYTVWRMLLWSASCIVHCVPHFHCQIIGSDWLPFFVIFICNSHMGRWWFVLLSLHLGDKEWGFSQTLYYTIQRILLWSASCTVFHVQHFCLFHINALFICFLFSPPHLEVSLSLGIAASTVTGWFRDCHFFSLAHFFGFCFWFACPLTPSLHGGCKFVSPAWAVEGVGILCPINAAM